tara:strand:- start:2399 stop:2614 length:216 start_codon:yes stop_codon:yes gene_type:complete
MWDIILKNEAQIYAEFKRRNKHLWDAAQGYEGQGEVATLDSIVMDFIRKNKGKPNMFRELYKVAEGYIMSN